MPAKREASPSPSPSATPPQTPSKKPKTVTASPRTPKNGKSIATTSTPSTPGNGWTPEKREALIEELLLAGMRSVKAADVASKVGITAQQYKDATQSGKNNLRAKVIKAAGTFGK